MKRATLEIEFVTPCFLSGADQKGAAEWRAASVRGQLRWWFRAVAGGPFGRDVQRVKAAEEEVFGSTVRSSVIQVQALGAPGTWAAGSDHSIGERLSAQRLADIWRLDPKDEPQEKALERLRVYRPQDRTKTVPSNPLQYLGYGCVGLHGLDRSCIAPRQTARLRLVWNEGRWNRLTEPSRSCFVRALWAWLHLGALGSRSRNGWGSLRCTKLVDDLPTSDASFSLPADRGSLERGIRELLELYSAAEPSAEELEWSQLSGHTAVYVGEEAHDSWDGALSHAGAWVVAYRRRYGAPDDYREGGRKTLANRDYAWAAPRSQGQSSFRGGLPDRAGFGLPLPFGRHEAITWHDPRNPGADGDRRRASPLLIRVARVQEGYLPVLTHIPSRFLPSGAEIRFKGQRRPSAAPSSRQLGIVGRFLDDLLGKKLVRRIS